jgi:hypothetical protein
MEFDTDHTPTPDEDRRLAEAKQLTLQPLHDDIAPEPTSNTEAAARHLAEAAIGNVENDIEQNVPLMQPSKGMLQGDQPAASKRSFSVLFAAVSLAVLALVGAAVFLVLR